jgi:hypothetical protein
MTETCVAAALVGFLLVAGGCGGGADGTKTEPTSGPASGTAVPTRGPAHLDPSNFVSTVDNAYYPLTPGTVWEYEATEGGKKEHDVVKVLDQTRMVDGVPAIVVHDVVRSAGGKVVEDTHDWFAQDKAGNVWYVGEDTKAYGKKGTSSEGSWEAGVDGARAGVVMPAHPTVGQAYQQEYYRGQAEDRGKILSLDTKVTVPTGTYDHVVLTADTSPLEPGLVEHKWYAKGIGTVKEQEIKGGNEKVTLVEWSKPNN